MLRCVLYEAAATTGDGNADDASEVAAARGPGLRVYFSIQEQLHPKNVKRFTGGLVCEALRLVYDSTLGSRVIKRKKKFGAFPSPPGGWVDALGCFSRGVSCSRFQIWHFLGPTHPSGPRPSTIAREQASYNTSNNIIVGLTT